MCTARTQAKVKSGKMADLSVTDAQVNFKKAIEKGVLKILSKMGISLLSCYHGAQIFEIYGLGEEVVDLAFRGSVSRIGGLSVDDLQREVESFWIKVTFASVCQAAYTTLKTSLRVLRSWACRPETSPTETAPPLRACFSQL